MIKTIKKLLIFTLISSILSTGLIVFADDELPVRDASEVVNRFANNQKVLSIIDDLKEKPQCITEAEINAGKIITYLEEPLYIQSSPSDPEKDVQYRLCYRHTFQYFDGEDNLTTFPYTTGPVNENQSSCSQPALELVRSEIGQEKASRYSCKEIQVIISSIAGTKLLYGYIGLIYRWAASIVGVITVLIIVISGIQISASAGNAEATGSAKTRIVQSISGLALLFLSGLLLNIINPNFFAR